MTKGDVCIIPDCKNITTSSHRICSTHRSRWKKNKSYGKPIPDKPALKEGIVKICLNHGELKKEDCVAHTGNHYRCRECNKARCLKWKKAHPTAWKERYKKERDTDNYQKNMRRSLLRKKFGMTLEDYEKILRMQNGVCKICKQKESVRDKRTGRLKMLSVDHCHKTGKIRELLCIRCNATLGMVNDSNELLDNLSLYVRRHKAAE